MITFEDVMQNTALSSIKKVLRENLPLNAEELLTKCALPLKLVDHGQFRNVFEVIGTRYVIKVPKPGEGYEDNLFHAEMEFEAWKRVTKSSHYRPIKKYLPVIRYYDFNSGVCLADRYYPIKSYDKKYNDEITKIHDHLIKLGYPDPDVNHEKWDNYGLDHDGNLRLLDLGCFYQ